MGIPFDNSILVDLCRFVYCHDWAHEALDQKHWPLSKL